MMGIHRREIMQSVMVARRLKPARSMVRCPRTGCRWQSIAPSEEAARTQYAKHLVAEHTTEVDAEIPDGMVEVRLGEDDEWRLMTVEEAKALHEDHHGD